MTSPNDVAAMLGLPVSPEIPMRLTCPKCGHSWTGMVPHQESLGYYCKPCLDAKHGAVELLMEAIE
jgi:hypothetical protein